MGGDAQFVHYLVVQPKLKPEALSVKRSQFMPNWLHFPELCTIGTIIVHLLAAGVNCLWLFQVPVTGI